MAPGPPWIQPWFLPLIVVIIFLFLFSKMFEDVIPSKYFNHSCFSRDSPFKHRIPLKYFKRANRITLGNKKLLFKKCMRTFG